MAGTPVAVGDAHGAELFRILNRYGAEANGINKLEDGGISADTEGQREHGDDGEAGT